MFLLGLVNCVCVCVSSLSRPLYLYIDYRLKGLNKGVESVIAFLRQLALPTRRHTHIYAQTLASH